MKRTKHVLGPVKNRKSSRSVRPKEEWIEIPVPAILDSDTARELFARGQAQLIKNAAISPRDRKNSYLVGGLFTAHVALLEPEKGHSRVATSTIDAVVAIGDTLMCQNVELR